MIKKLLALSISISFSLTPALVHAEGNKDAGRTAAASCTSCHGEDGNSMVSSFPKLAGQHESYLVRQLQDLKDGFRNAPMMAPLAMALSDQTIEDVSAFYASQKISANQAPIIQADDDEDEEPSEEEKAETLKQLLATGSDLYRNGNLKTKVSACIACHGPEGEGNKPSSFPSLRGQHADYLISSLQKFKKGKRTKSSDNMMHLIAKKMSDEEIKAVSYHISMKK